jgi:hypothetical protein
MTPVIKWLRAEALGIPINSQYNDRFPLKLPLSGWLGKENYLKGITNGIGGLHIPSRRVEFVDDNTKMLVY